jgi:hypothetical protein
MKIKLLRAAFAAFGVFCLAQPARANCVISPDGKSIHVVVDNSASDEKNCAVKCQVDTKIGIVQVSCGGNTPPLAKDHSLCAFDKPEPWYKKVISSADSCKASAETAPAPGLSAAAGVAAPRPAKTGFACKISADCKTVDPMIDNPYGTETSCQVNCQISTTQAGTTHGISCTKNIAPGVGQAVVCSHTYGKERLVKMVSGNGECIKPLAPDADTARDKKNNDNDDDVDNIPTDPAQLREYIRKELAKP